MTKKQDNINGEMPLFSHLAELRIRLFRSFIVLFICVIGCYFFRKEILDTFRKPIEQPLAKYSSLVPNETISKPEQTILDSQTIPNQDQFNCHCVELPPPQNNKKIAERLHLNCFCDPILATTSDQAETIPIQATSEKTGAMVFINIPEVFFAHMKVAFFAGLFLAFPYLLIEIWGFVGPALYRSEKKVFWSFAVSTYLFFTVGALFGYFFIFPFGFEFFLSLTQPGEIVPSLSIGNYLTFTLKLLFAFGFVFELPVVVAILSRFGLITPSSMIKNAKFALLVIFILAAIITPPDPFTMLLMATPLVVLYIFSICIAFLTFNRKTQKEL